MSSELLKKIKESEKNLFVGIAGPGTGKSTTFKTIIESDEYKDKKILILSFINKLVDDLSIDFKSFNNVTVLTLHAFAKQQIVDVDLNEDLDAIISEDYFFVTGKSINYEKKFYENNLSKEEEDFYTERKNFYKYKKELFSFNSIIYKVNSFFNENETNIPSQYELILIDEFQDFNQSEYELIKLLNKKSKVVIVGDDDQSLYGDFRSAKPEQIRNLYNHNETEEFTLDYCYRCTRVIVDAVNSLIDNAKNKGYLKERLHVKKFLYPEKRNDDKNDVSEKNKYIDFISCVSGDQLIYKLSEKIKKDIENEKIRRILILVPSYFKQTIYEGLLSKKFNIVEFELFYDEKSNKVKHKKLISIFDVLSKRKTDNLALRRILFLYINNDSVSNIIIKSNEENKKIWSYLDKDIKEKIESDIKIFKKTKNGKNDLNSDELNRLAEVFCLKRILSKMLTGFNPVMRQAIEIEMTTVMSSKGLSADYVYFIGIDDSNMLDSKTKTFSDQKICEFLVGITRAKKKLTLFSLWDQNPQILELIDQKYIRKE